MQSKPNQIFQYNGSPITFEKGDSVTVNLTDMAKAFPSKNLTQIVNSQEVKEYCESLSKLYNYSLVDLLIVMRGGNNNGTWAHQKVALRVAQKLSPEFAVWVDSKIEELLTTSSATLLSEDEILLRSQEILQNRLQLAKQQLQIATGTIEHQEEQIKVLAPKAQYTDDVLQSTSTYTMTQIAKELGYSAHTFASKLAMAGILYRQSNQWLLTSKYQNKDYTRVRTAKYFHADGSVGTSPSTVWTEKGRQFLWELKNKGKKQAAPIVQDVEIALMS